MFRSVSLFIGTSFIVAVFTIFATSNVDSILGIPQQNIFNAKNFNPHNKPISLLNVPICTQCMQRTWWSEAGTIIVTGPNGIYFNRKAHGVTIGDLKSTVVLEKLNYTLMVARPMSPRLLWRPPTDATILCRPNFYIAIHVCCITLFGLCWGYHYHESWAPFQYAIRRFIVRSREVWKPRDWYL